MGGAGQPTFQVGWGQEEEDIMLDNTHILYSKKYYIARVTGIIPVERIHNAEPCEYHKVQHYES